MKRKWLIAGILIAFEVLICAVILFTVWSSRAVFQNVRLFYVADTCIEETVERAFTVDGPAAVDLENDFGHVTVIGGEGDQVEVVAAVHLCGVDEEDARKQADVQMTQSGDQITVQVVRPEPIHLVFGSTRVSGVDFEIHVPSETSLRLVNSSGDLEVDGVTGTVELVTSFGDIEVEDIRGPVSARSSSGDVTLTKISDGGDMEVRTEFGALDLRDVAGDSLQAKSRSGEIRLERGELSGALDLDAEFGEVAAVGVAAASYRLHSSSGGLTLEGGSGQLDLQTEFGDIEVSRVEEAELLLKTNSGKITFSGSLGDEGEHRVESDFGAVRLSLPADSAFDLDARTEFGSIDTDFAVTVSRFEERHLVGEVNGGGPLLRIEVSSGDIALESVVEQSN